jgi:protein SCO1/2
MTSLTKYLIASATVLSATGALGIVARARASTPDDAITLLHPTRSDYSVFDLASTWRDQDGRSVSLASLRGRPRAMAMVYTHCTSTCPLILETLKQLEAKTDSSVAFVLVSIDPARDSVGQLAAYAREHGLSSRWTLLAGDDDAIRELAATLGVNYRRLSADELAHANVITVLDRDGAVVAQQPSWDATDVLAALRAGSR